MNEVKKFNCDHVTMAFKNLIQCVCHTGMFVQYLLRLKNKPFIVYFWFEFVSDTSVRIQVRMGP